MIRYAASRACGCARSRSTTSTSTPASRPTDWSDAFAAHLIESMLKRGASEESYRVLATDLAPTWVVGDADDGDSATVSGPPATWPGG